jgi:hypothetical protein
VTAVLALALSACSTSKSATPESIPSAAPAPADPRAAPDASTLALYRAWIAEARAKHPYADSVDRMYAVMMCESGGRLAVVNPAGPYTGLFQYVAGTWNGTWNTYRTAGMVDAKAQIFATALAWSLNMQSHWGCYRKTAPAG